MNEYELQREIRVGVQQQIRDALKKHQIVVSEVFASQRTLVVIKREGANMKWVELGKDVRQLTDWVTPATIAWLVESFDG